MAPQTVCAIRPKSWAMILKPRFIGPLAVQWLTVSVIHLLSWLLIPSRGFVSRHVQVMLALLQLRWSAGMNHRVILTIR